MSKTINVEITHPVGLYANPVTELVQTIRIYNCQAQLKYNQKKVNLRSMMGVLSLGIPCKAKITIKTTGEDEGLAMNSLIKKIKELDLGEII